MCEIKCIADFINQVVEEIKKNNANDDKIVVYRGEPNVYPTPGMPGIFRDKYIEKEPFFEKNLLNEMKSNRITEGTTFLERAVDAQHDEFPSRLLDVTYNALVALYFAVTPYYKRYAENAFDNKEDCQVIIYFLPHMYCAGADNLEDAFNRTIKRSSGDDGYLLHTLAQENYKLIDHLKMNTRICVQQGAFIMFQGDEYTAISPKDYVTVKIRKEYRKKLREELNSLFGINTGFIYPEPYNLYATMGNKAYKIINTEINCKNELNSFLNRIDGEIDFYFKKALDINETGKDSEEIKNMVTQIVMELEELLMKYKIEFCDYIDIFLKDDKEKWVDKFNGLIDMYKEKFTMYEESFEIKMSMKELFVDEGGILNEGNE